MYELVKKRADKHENYIDRNTCVQLGNFFTDLDLRAEHVAAPRGNGNRAECRNYRHYG
ncbi:MAG: hypothetical protein K2N17_05205 [Clostridia bacterium]|nr:hypothetical protein [Clostridia bacterium]